MSNALLKGGLQVKMPKIYISKDGQGKINIPKEIMRMKNWDSETEILISPLISEPKARIGAEVPIIIIEMAVKEKKERK